jgi:hypothetical protein
LAFCGLLVLASVSPPTRAQDAEQARKALATIPALQGLTLAPLASATKGYATKLGGATAAVFATKGAGGAQVWNLALLRDQFSFADVLPDPLSEVSLSNAVIIVSGANSAAKLADLPTDLVKPLRNLGIPPDSDLSLQGGVNFFAQVSVGRLSSGALADVAYMLGYQGTAVITGRVGANIVRFLAGVKSAASPDDLKSVNLSLRLGSASPSALAAIVTAEALTVDFTWDGKTVAMAGSATVTVNTTPRLSIPVKLAVNVPPNYIELSGEIDPKKVGLPSVEQLSISKLRFSASKPTRDAKPFFGFVGSGRLGQTNLDLAAALSQDSAGKPQFLLFAIEKKLSLASYFPELLPTPLAALELNDATLILVPSANQATRVQLASLPEAVATSLGGAAKTGIDLNPGVNLWATLDVSKSVEVKAILQAVGVSATSAALHGTLDPAKLSSAKFSIPVPSIKPPGAPAALSFSPRQLEIGTTVSIDATASISLAGRTLTVDPLKIVRDAKSGKVNFDGAVKADPASVAGVTLDSFVLAASYEPAPKGFSAQLKAKLTPPGSTTKRDISADLSKTPRGGEVSFTTDLSVTDFVALPAALGELGQVKLTDLSFGKSYASATVNYRKENTRLVLFAPSDSKRPNLAIVHEQFQLGDYLDEVADTPFAALELEEIAVLVAPTEYAVTAVDPAALPATLQAALKSLGSPIKAGVSFYASVKPSSAATVLGPWVEALKLQLPAKIPLRGTLDGTTPGTGKSAATPRVPSVAKLLPQELAFDLPAIKPPGISLNLDAGRFALTRAAGGKADVFVSAELEFSLGEKKIPLIGKFRRAAGTFSFAAATKDGAQPDFAIRVPGLTIKELSLAASYDKEAFDLHLAGSGTLDFAADKSKSVMLKVDLAKAAGAEVAVSVTTDLSVTDFVALPAALGELGQVKLTDLSFGKSYASATVNYRKENTRLVLFAPSDSKRPNLAIVHEQFQLGDYLDEVADTPFAALELEEIAVLVAPTEYAVTAVDPAALPATLQAALKSLGSPIKAGVSFYASVKPSSAATVLGPWVEALKLQLPAKIPLRGTLDGTTPGTGKSAATPRVPSVAKLLPQELAFDLPAIKPPGISLNLDAGRFALTRAAGGKADVFVSAELEFSLGEKKIPLIGKFRRAAGTFSFAAATKDGAQPDFAIRVPGLTIKELSLAASYDKEAFDLHLAGSGTLDFAADKSKSVMLKVDLAKAAGAEVAVSVTTDLSVTDFVALPAALGELGQVKLTDLSFGKSYASATVSYKNEPTKVALFVPATRGKTPTLALIHNNLQLSHYLPAVQGTPLADMKLGKLVLMLTPTENQGASVDLPELAVELQPISLKSLPRDLLTVLAQGRVPEKVTDWLAPLGVKLPDEIAISGSLGAATAAATGTTPAAPRTTSDQAKKAGAELNSALAALVPENLGFDLPAIKPPGIGDYLRFDSGRFALKRNPAGGIDAFVSADLTLTLDAQTQFKVAGQFSRAQDPQTKTEVLSLSADTDLSLDSPFGLKWLSVKEGKLGASIDTTTRAVNLSLAAKATIAGQPYQLTTRFIEEKGALKDVVFALEGKIPLSDIPGVQNIPGLSQISFQNIFFQSMEVSRTHLAGEISIDKVTASAALLLDAGPALFFQATPLKLAELIPPLEETLLKDVRLPNTVFVVGKIDARSVNSLPDIVRQEFWKVGITDKIDTPGGLTLFSRLDPEGMPEPFKKALDLIGLKGGLLLKGSVELPFLGSQDFSLRLAADLPSVPLPQGFENLLQSPSGPGPVPKFLLQFGQNKLSVGFGADFSVPIKNTVLPMQVQFDVNVGAGAAPSIDAKGTMQGDWKQAFGINWLTIQELDLALALKPGAAGPTISVGAGGNFQLGEKGTTVHGSVQFNPATTKILPLPESLSIAINDGPGKVGQVTLKEFVWVYNEMMKAANVQALVPLDQVPDVAITGTQLGEGPSISLNVAAGPDAGFDIEGALRVLGTEIGRIEKASVHPGSGINIQASTSPIAVGPIEIEKSSVQIVLQYKGDKGAPPLPIIAFKGGVILFDNQADLLFTLSPQLAEIQSDAEFGAALKFKFYASTGEKIQSFNDLKEKVDFQLKSTLSTDPGQWLRTADAGDAVKKAFDAVNPAAQDAEKELQNKKADVDRLSGNLRDMRAQVRGERADVSSQLRAAESEVGRLQGEIKTYTTQIENTQRKIERCDQTYRTFWGQDVPDLPARGLCDVRNAGRYSYIAAQEAGRAAVIAAKDGAQKTLESLQSGITSIPIDADPRVAGLISAYNVAYIALGAAERAVQGFTNFGSLLDQGLTALGADGFSMRDGLIEGSLRKAIGGEPAVLSMNYRLLGQDYFNAFAFSLTDPAFNARQLEVLGLAIVTQTIMKAGSNMGIIPHELLTKVNEIYLAKQAEVDKEVTKALAAHNIRPRESKDPSIASAMKGLDAGLAALKNGDRIALVADNGWYVARVNRGTGYNPIEAQPDGMGRWAIFTVTVLPNGKVTLQADNGQSVGRVNRGTGYNPIEAYPDPSPEFTLVMLPNGKVALAANNGEYIGRVDRGGGQNPIETQPGEIGYWAQFTLHRVR